MAGEAAVLSGSARIFQRENVLHVKLDTMVQLRQRAFKR